MLLFILRKYLGVKLNTEELGHRVGVCLIL